MMGSRRSESGSCPTCGGRGWHTAGGNDPAACSCPAGEAWAAPSFERGAIVPSPRSFRVTKDEEVEPGV